MNKRIIGGTLYFLIFAFGVFSQFYLFLFPFFIVVGVGEVIKMSKRSTVKNYPVAIGYSVLFIFAMLSIMYLINLNPGFVFYIALLIMLDDTFAYAVGKAIGKHQLSKISPNKTIEGSIGGIVGGFIGAIGVIELIQTVAHVQIPFCDLSSVYHFNIFSNFPELALVSFVILVSGQAGDLLESKVKRTFGAKDSGKIVYGHGGVLDRLDSLVAASLLVTAYILIGV